MLVPFSEFTMATDGGGKISVSSLQVTYIAQLPNGNTKIVFDGTHNVLVKESMAEVVRGLAG